jgi:hypothetical protein
MLIICALVSFSTVAFPAATWAGGQVVVQNDSIVDFSQAIIQAGFATSERASAWLTPSCSGEITAVRILWLSLSGGAGQTLGDSITISEAGAFPNPGAQLLQLSGPQMTDGAFNEFTIAPPIPVTAGQAFVVDFRFLQAPPVTGPSVVNDADGCQEGFNGIFAIPPSVWFSSCLLGVSGDFAIRAVVSCGASNTIFSDGFESGDTLAWSDVIP